LIHACLVVLARPVDLLGRREQRIPNREPPLRREADMMNVRGNVRKSIKRSSILLAMVAMVAVGATACLPPPPAPPAAPAAAAPPDATTAGVMDAMNRDRAANGVPALAWNKQLAGLGSGWAAHLAGANGGLVHQDLTSVLHSPGYQGYTTLGENLLVGPQGMTTDSMEAAWMASSGHRANILRGAFTSAGVGYTYANGKIWVAVEFGG
jgi:uncharacterized protein YkwD